LGNGARKPAVMNIEFSTDDLAFQEEVAAFLRDELPERLKEGARRTPGVFVEPDIGMDWHRILHQKGWVAPSWPKEDGGTGWTATQKYIFEKECALAGAPALSVLGLKLVGPIICKYGTPEQKARFLPGILSGENYWCQGYSEPGSGSDLASLKTKAERKGDTYHINGTKIWTTHAQYADWMFCLVRTDSECAPQRGISFLLMPMQQPGVTITPIITMAGDHEVNQVFMDNATSDANNLIGEEGQGWEIAKFLLENERGGSCLAPKLLVDIDRIEILAGKTPSGENGPMDHDPDIAKRIAKLRIKARALEITELRILAELANGNRPGPQTSLTKLVGANLRQDVDTLAMDLFGYDGMQLPLERPLYGNGAPSPIGSEEAMIAAGRYLNSRAWTIFGGSDEVQKNIISKVVLGL
jgi:alkylation response protein AidB-like acyl-CoA dehydrogenase